MAKSIFLEQDNKFNRIFSPNTKTSKPLEKRILSGYLEGRGMTLVFDGMPDSKSKLGFKLTQGKISQVVIGNQSFSKSTKLSKTPFFLRRLYHHIAMTFNIGGYKEEMKAKAHAIATAYEKELASQLEDSKGDKISNNSSEEKVPGSGKKTHINALAARAADGDSKAQFDYGIYLLTHLPSADNVNEINYQILEGYNYLEQAASNQHTTALLVLGLALTDHPQTEFGLLPKYPSSKSTFEKGYKYLETLANLDYGSKPENSDIRKACLIMGKSYAKGFYKNGVDYVIDVRKGQAYLDKYNSIIE